MLNFYYIDKAYADYLREVDNKVPTLDYDTHNKFFCGVVFSVNGIKYYAPISHETRRQQTNIVITDRGRAISSIKFSFMIPAPDKVLSRIDFNEIAQTDPNYANLLRAEYAFCSKHERDILAKAEAVHRIGCNIRHRLYNVCCKFDVLEGQMNKYLTEQTE